MVELSLNQALNLAEQTAREAGQHLIEQIEEIHDVDTKRNFTDLVTEVDLSSQELIIDKLHSHYPSHTVVAEEKQNVPGTDMQWIVDPIDGTTNYVHSYPIFSVSIALAEQQNVLVGVVYAPMLKEMFTAKKGGGAWLNGKPISTSGESDLSKALLSTGFPYSKDQVEMAMRRFNSLVRKSRGIRRDGSAALDLSFVAMGRFDGFWEQGLSPWDVAAGKLIAEEAGAKITTFTGNEHQLFSSNNITASNGKIHDHLTEILTNNNTG